TLDDGPGEAGRHRAHARRRRGVGGPSAPRAGAEAGKRRPRADRGRAPRGRRAAAGLRERAPHRAAQPLGALSRDLFAAGGGLMGRRDPLPRESLVGVQVLVIDDDPEACELLATILGYCGAFVTSATSAAAGL